MSPELVAFWAEVCTFMRDEMAGAGASGSLNSRDRTGLALAFERELMAAAGRRGYLAVSVAPPDGAGRPPAFAGVVEYEAAHHDAPLVDTAMVLAGAPILAFATDAQRERYLGPMQRGEIETCIAYSEPAAGNDLGALTTRAVASGDGYVLDGCKWLITGADKAESCLTIALTDPEAARKSAMTMFLVDMDTPGVSVVAQPTIAGYDVFEVRFDQVQLGSESVLGIPGAGWGQMMQSVAAERGRLFNAGWCQRLVEELAQLCRAWPHPGGDGPLIADPIVAERFAQAWLLNERVRHLSWDPIDDQRDSISDAIAKVTSTEALQTLAAVGSSLAGAAGAAVGSLFPPSAEAAAERLAFERRFRFDGTVSVGANEIHRSAIGRYLTSPERAASPGHRDATAPTTAQVLQLVADLDGVGDPDALIATPSTVAAPAWARLAEVQRRLGQMAVASPLVEGWLLPGLLAGQPGSSLVAILDRVEHRPGSVVACLTDATGVVRRHGVATASMGPGGVKVLGRYGFVGFADGADYLLCSAFDGAALTVCVVDPNDAGVTIESVCLPNGRQRFTVSVDVVVSPEAVQLLDPARMQMALDRAHLASSVWTGAACEELVHITARHVATRQQYGSPLSALQAVAHRVADMEIERRGAAAMTEDSILAVAVVAADTELACLSARVAWLNSAEQIVRSAHQLCGGQGYLAEFGLAPFTAELKALESFLEPALVVRRRLAELLSASLRST